MYGDRLAHLARFGSSPEKLCARRQRRSATWTFGTAAQAAVSTG